MRHLKGFLMLFVLTILAVGFNSVEAESPNYEILSVEVDDLLAYSSSGSGSITELDVERGDTIDIEVVIEGAEGTGELIDDVFAEAKIIGYEFGSISDMTGPFSIEAGKTYKKTLTLGIPYDIDASEVYTLRIEVSDALDEEYVYFDLHIDEQRHDLNIYDVLLSSSTITAGNPVFVTARIENLGEKKEEDIKVKVSVPELGISAVGFIDELDTQEQEESEMYKDSVDSSKQIDLLLHIPEDAETGTYEVRVDVEYNRGHSFLSESLSINVEGLETDKGVQTILNSDSTSKIASAGEEVEYKIMIANLGEETGIYSVQVDGVSTWAELSVDPGFLTVMPDSTGEVIVKLSPFGTQESESHSWVAKVMLGTTPIGELTFTTKVDVGETKVAAGGDVVKTVLAVIFGILVVVLIVLALIIAFRRTGNTEETAPMTEGQTYYYSPKR